MCSTIRVIIAGVFAIGFATGCQQDAADVRPDPDPEPTQSPIAAPALPDAWVPPRPELRPDRPGGTDKGIFSDKQDSVRLHYPEWIRGAQTTVSARDDRFVFVDGVAVGVAPPNTSPAMSATYSDHDSDGIPDQLDALIGAKKTVANGAPYQGGYQKLDFPGGDVPRTEGVCTDVIVRAFRNAGIDLQKELYDDIGRAPRAFPMVKKRDTNIDHRRVKTLLPYFERQWDKRATASDDIGDWIPGDVVFMNTMGDSRPDHVGIVSDRLGKSGKPLIINNWTNGYQTSEMDLVGFVPITHRFRLKQTFSVPDSERGVAGLLRRHGVDASDSKQLMLVTADSWSSASATLTRWDLAGGTAKQFGEPVEVTLGSAGLGIGQGLPTKLAGHPWKVEGDRRSPAGAFRLGTAFGRSKPGGDWPFRAVDAGDSWVDDPALPTYNTWVTEPPDGSHEKLTMYDLGLVVEHNTTDTKRGAGSAIFLHTWQGERGSTLGCTAMKKPDLVETLKWLDPDARPIFVQVVDRVH